jgi:glycosyltransferase involved in cell wall biosynthesis
VIEALPDVSFEVVGPRDAGVEPHVMDRLFAQRNVVYSGELVHDRVLERIGNAKLLLNTSPAEGFPNSMLEAWSLGRPVLSLAVDPDDLLSGPEPLGFCARGDITRLASAIRCWRSDAQQREAAGTRAREYIVTYHSADRVCEAYERLLVCESRTL